MDCCFSKQYKNPSRRVGLVQNGNRQNQNVTTCSRYNRPRKLLTGRKTTITHSLNDLEREDSCQISQH